VKILSCSCSLPFCIGRDGTVIVENAGDLRRPGNI
jgi:hypothetical protein